MSPYVGPLVSWLVRWMVGWAKGWSFGLPCPSLFVSFNHTIFVSNEKNLDSCIVMQHSVLNGETYRCTNYYIASLAKKKGYLRVLPNLKSLII